MSALQPVKILSYNVQGLPSLLLPIADLDIRMDHIANFISSLFQKYDVDIMVLQEVFSYSLYNKIKDALRGIAEDTGIISRPVSNSVLMSCLDTLLSTFSFITSGIVIFSRHPIVYKERLLFSNGFNAERYAGKGAVAARISVNGNLLDVIGTHLQSDEGEDAQEIRNKQLIELAEWIGINPLEDERAIAERDSLPYVPMVLAGDLNCSLDSETERFSDVVAALNDKLEDTFGYNQPEPTYSTLTNDFCAFQNNPNVFNHVYDYILKNHESTLLEAQRVIKDKLETAFVLPVCDEDDDDCVDPEMYNVSDHYPIIATIGI
ncbi:Endonuclease/Exonuclease/phosphatase family protein [Babesia bovis T2Bo]|uniref:sphingomyelin phosphodiesterase n=1 Tax=Babesia bovis TaxID=5865 RepID=A7AR39_BABBO|nr:Endonuclease/Exonuclease/phosphatase family protein [Babesia bovis T2Bo]EDO07008.1 Endonuclease/Exonuclease/phosphatase family protein [Babesia bovis T2Bo]BAN65610.1 endonuclease/exonuclease/phosphatase family protein [Babesia bovis]|eukprot:XP_001610576.1 endonuclease/exonuclease/phosphatase family protein [Babesia bovis T2Bo]